jgi:tRNA pseudouridine38-40 synthase
MVRVALGLAYRGSAYLGWQSQPCGQTIQDRLERALGLFADEPIKTLCAGRTDAGVHGLNQVVHFDTSRDRDAFSWVRGVNRYLPSDIAVQWSALPGDDFHARNHARRRRYAYVLLESAVRPAMEAQSVGWVFRPLDQAAMEEAAALLIGEHDFSAFRASGCQALSPVKHMGAIQIRRRGAYWRFDFEANAFLHHMIRNLMGGLIAVGQGSRPAAWMKAVLESRDRTLAAPTFAPDGLYFLGPQYDPGRCIPTHTPAMDWLP